MIFKEICYVGTIYVDLTRLPDRKTPRFAYVTHDGTAASLSGMLAVLPICRELYAEAKLLPYTFNILEVYADDIPKLSRLMPEHVRKVTWDMKVESNIGSLSRDWPEGFKAIEAFYKLKKIILISVPGVDFSDWELELFKQLMLIYASYGEKVELEVVLPGNVEDAILCRRRHFIS